MILVFLISGGKEIWLLSFTFYFGCFGRQKENGKTDPKREK